MHLCSIWVEKPQEIIAVSSFFLNGLAKLTSSPYGFVNMSRQKYTFDPMLHG